MADLSQTVPESKNESSPAAYQRLLPKILEVEGALPHINVDVMVVVTSIIGRMQGIEAMADVLSSKLKDFDPQLIAELDDYTRALQHAHGLYIQATKAPAALQELIDRGTHLRDMLHADAIALAKRGLLNPDAFKDVKRSNGHRPLIVDLQVLVATFRERWDSVKDRTAVRPEELDSTVALIDTLTEAVGLKEYSPAAQVQATMIRQKAFTLVTRTYEKIRDGLVYARREEGDADDIAPSLYVGRSNGNKRPDDQTPEDPTDGPPVTPAPPSASNVAVQQPNLTSSLTTNVPFARSNGGA